MKRKKWKEITNQSSYWTLKSGSILLLIWNQNLKLKPACFLPNLNLLLAGMPLRLLWVSNLARLNIKPDWNLHIANLRTCAEMRRYKSKLPLFWKEILLEREAKGESVSCCGNTVRSWLQDSWSNSELSASTASSWPTRGCEGKSSVGETQLPEPELSTVILRKPSGAVSWSNCGYDRAWSVYLSKWAKSRLLRRLSLAERTHITDEVLIIS